MRYAPPAKGIPHRRRPVPTLHPVLFAWLAIASLSEVRAGDEAQLKVAERGGVVPEIAQASDEGANAINQFKLAEGLSVKLWAAEPLLANPVALSSDYKGRFYVAETFRLHAGVSDVMVHKKWLESELASTNLDSWLAILKGDPTLDLARTDKNSERVQLIWDSTGSGVADKSSVFADGFNGSLSGIAAGVLPRKNKVYLACIPDLWQLEDTHNTGKADVRKSLAHGFGVRTGVLGHDLHGLRLGPDGRLYFSMGDRGANATAVDGSHVFNPESGAVYRCNQDGTELELFATGLRNPQHLAFDEYGNLFTVDNNTSFGDPSRIVYIFQGGDSGWRIGWQFLTQPPRGGAWVSERISFPAFEGQPAHHIPPIAGLSNGPSGFSYNPGTALSARWKGHFFLADFRGSPANSGIHSFTLTPKGAGFEATIGAKPLWQILATDAQFGVDGGLYVADWVNGWGLTGKGRIYRVSDSTTDADPIVKETKVLLADGMEKRPLDELAHLLAHPDMRVRQEAQFELVDRGEFQTLQRAAAQGSTTLVRIHGIWGLGQLCRNTHQKAELLLAFLKHADMEVRAQAAKTLGDLKFAPAGPEMIPLLKDESARVRSFAAVGLGRIGFAPAVPALFSLLRDNRDQDPVLRYAAVSGLMGCATSDVLQSAAKDPSRSVRIGAVNALRRTKNPAVARFLKDPDGLVIAEAARAIYDESIEAAMPDLAELLGSAESLLSLPEGSKEQPGPRDAILHRAIRANFRVGKEINANMLARFTKLVGAPDVLKVEALSCLEEWQAPSNLDKVIGLYRPLAARDTTCVKEAVAPIISSLIADGTKTVRLAALQLVSKFKFESISLDLFTLAKDPTIDAEVRVEALRAMATREDPRLTDAVLFATSDASELIRKEALILLVKLSPEGGILGPLTQVLQKGTIGEKQNVITILGGLSGLDTDEVLVQQLNTLVAGKLSPELQLEVLEAAAKRAAPEIQNLLQKYQAALDPKDSLASYRIALNGGDPIAGKKVFMEKLEASCVRCHKVKNEGGDVGPDLTKVGSRATREYLLESIVDPNAKIAEGYESVMVTTKDGAIHAGILKKEDAEEIVVMPPTGIADVIRKQNIKTREKGLSGMPPLGLVISKRDLRDVVAYLSSLK